MTDFKYILDSNGYPVAYGYGMWPNGISLTGNEPFKGFDIVDYRKNMSTGAWIYDPIQKLTENIIEL